MKWLERYEKGLAEREAVAAEGEVVAAAAVESGSDTTEISIDASAVDEEAEEPRSHEL
ncbi:MAG: hypothetical protein HC902_06820 [Calothrix sp. SM1_5_4]|nr:hypothetical protein [Calothrix sp. SM1_5_4]